MSAVWEGLLTFAPILILIASVWLTYWDALKCTWASDDWAGILYTDETRQKFYGGEFVRWKIKPGEKKDLPQGELYAPPWSYGNVLRWARFRICRSPNTYKDYKKHNQPDYVADPVKCHRLNMILYSGVVVSVYCLLAHLFGPTLAFFSTLLFVFHPLGCQTVAWVSGIGYLLCLFFGTLAIHTAILSQLWGHSTWAVLASLLLFSVFEFLCVQALFAGAGVAAVLLWMGPTYWPYTVIAFLITTIFCVKTFHEAVSLRRAVFKKQLMEASTKFHARKVIVAIKSLYYYTKLILFPKRMGLYHTFCYHYELPKTEWEDNYFWAGCGILVLGGLGLWLGPPAVQFGIVWWVAFLILFANWVTVNQFVSERYAWMPALGACVMISWGCLTWGLLWLYWLLAGVALMRTWSHIPTYYNEVNFYLSNVWNFPDSEIAYGNLGVSYLNVGLPGAAVDSWMKGSQINPEYDVNFYNIFSAHRSQAQEAFKVGRLHEAAQALETGRHFLAKALSSKTCHFPVEWNQELAAVDADLDRLKKVFAGGGPTFSTGPYKPFPLNLTPK